MISNFCVMHYDSPGYGSLMVFGNLPAIDAVEEKAERIQKVAP